MNNLLLSAGVLLCVTGAVGCGAVGLASPWPTLAVLFGMLAYGLGRLGKDLGKG